MGATKPQIVACLNSPIDYLKTYMDQFNVQSDNPSNFTLVGGTKISQWNDLSPQLRHLTQSTDARRPLYNGGSPLFDGVDDVLQTAAQFQLSTFSFYAVVKSTTIPGTAQGIVGGSTTNYIGKQTSRQIGLDNSGNGGGNLRYILYGDESYMIISYRRTAATISIKVNGRTLIFQSGVPASANHNFRFVGSGAFGSGSIPWIGTIRAVCISSAYLTDGQDAGVLSQLFQKYALPEADNAIVGFGDSITYGQGATNSFTTAWMPLLAAAKGRPYKNYGIAGTTCSNVAASPNNGQSRWNINISERLYDDYICILYGTNDISAGGVYTATTYETALIAIISGLIAQGYAASKICVGTVPYRLADAFASTIAQYNTKIVSITSTYGLAPWADVYATMKAYGDGCMADGVHPNDIGHQIIANAFNAVLP